MKRRFITIALWSLTILTISACATKNAEQVGTISETMPSPTPTAVSTAQPYPNSVDLSFKPVEMEPLTEGEPTENWALLKIIPFGTINQEKVELYLYQEPKVVNQAEIRHVLLRYQDKNYLIKDNFTYDFSETFTGNDHSTIFLLEHSFSDPENQLLLLGGIEVESNGPGRLDYIMYDIKKGTWLVFSDWGKPQFVDLDSDGVEELVVQFEGLHLQWPDVSIYTWNNGVFEASRSLKGVIMGPAAKQSFANLEVDKTITFGENTEDGQILHYIYQNRKLIKQ